MSEDNMISYTQVSTYIKCPLQYKFKYIDKIPKTDSLYKIFGSAIHEALKYRNIELLESEHCNPQDVLGVASESWFRLLEHNNYKIQDHNCEFDLMMTVIDNYLKRNDRPRIIESEPRCILDLAKTTNGELKILLIGYIDGIISKNNGTVEIIEYKTSGHAWNANRQHLELQPDIYGLLLGADKLICNYDIMIKSTIPKFQWLPTERTQRNMVQALQTIKAVFKAIENNIYYPIRSYLCNPKYCDYTQECQGW